jgi:hypothetical protein
MTIKESWNKFLDNIARKVPLDYENGYIDGFTEGLKFYKDSIDMMHKAVLDSDKVKKDMMDRAKGLREVK